MLDIMATKETTPPTDAAPARDDSRAKGYLMLALGAVLVIGALGIVAWQLWPDISYNLGLVEEEWPYPTAYDASNLGEPIPQGVRVVIPKIGVDAQVMEGNPDVALAEGVYHHPDTAEPGEGDNIALAGHRNREAFVLLYQLREGDPISLWWNGEEHLYRVTRGPYDVLPDNEQVLAPADEEVLTLYTCRPRFVGNKRTVVEAEPMPAEELE
jgi:LPXTG-site transpeptidase (sortase) family protein